MPGARIVLAVARGAFISFASSAALVAGGLTLVAVCAAVGVLLYGLAHLFAFGFGIEFRVGTGNRLLASAGDAACLGVDS